MAHNNKEIPVKDAINLAVQAYIQNGKYHREDQYEYVETEDGPSERITVKGNKHLMREMFSQDQISIDPKCDAMVEDIYTHYQGLIFKIMSNQSTDFADNVYKVISKERIGYKELGYLAPLPSLYEHEMARDLFVKEIADSQHVGKLKEKVTVRAILHEARYIRSRDFHVYTFISEGNLITHFSQKGINEWATVGVVREGEEYSITFKVKRHGESSFYGCKDTVVNYLKISD
jgi:hypothetical protein